jgi:hypothetical protein
MLQVTIEVLHMEQFELWFDVMELPPTVNDIGDFLNTAKKDFGPRKVRIIQVIEE